MSAKLYWRQPQLSDTAHLSESAAHRALCGEDVLTAFTDSDVPRHAACVTCLAIAERSGLRRPPFSKPAIPDPHTRELIFNDAVTRGAAAPSRGAHSWNAPAPENDDA